ncbi:MAG: hypothetical protein HOC71_01490 [Candidatus Latescibacteria bacterium]|jgi:hypothetical protein|nr:hypothetical protein [Candidatus Latescibacterota bacterium]
MIPPRSHSYKLSLSMIFLFAVAMGYFEAAVVVYIREAFYPEGFSFPLKMISARFIIIELFREISTIIMLITVAVLSGKKFWERFGYFLILFGVWDIFYYVWLKATINWPSTLFDWDILFLIPLPWIGPVIAPGLVAVLMVAIGVSLTYLHHKGYSYKPSPATWMMAVAATVVLLYSFIRDVEAGLHQTMPQPYRYELLFIGLILYSAAYIVSYRKKQKTP